MATYFFCSFDTPLRVFFPSLILLSESLVHSHSLVFFLSGSIFEGFFQVVFLDSSFLEIEVFFLFIKPPKLLLSHNLPFRFFGEGFGRAHHPELRTLIFPPVGLLLAVFA